MQGGDPTWSIFSYLGFCTISRSAFGGVVENDASGPQNAPPSHWALCSAYNYPVSRLDPDVRGCSGVMGSLGSYRRWFTHDPSDTSARSGYLAAHAQLVTDVYNPWIDDQCFLGQITSEFHIHANHGVAWDQGLENTPGGIQWCPWHKK